MSEINFRCVGLHIAQVLHKEIKIYVTDRYINSVKTYTYFIKQCCNFMKSMRKQVFNLGPNVSNSKYPSNKNFKRKSVQ